MMLLNPSIRTTSNIASVVRYLLTEERTMVEEAGPMEIKTIGSKNSEYRRISEEIVCENGCTIPCSWCYLPEERMEFPNFAEVKGG